MKGVLIPRGTQFLGWRGGGGGGRPRGGQFWGGGGGGELAAFSRTQNPIIEIYMGKMM